jgi:hypothetical protein
MSLSITSGEISGRENMLINEKLLLPTINLNHGSNALTTLWRGRGLEKVWKESCLGGWMDVNPWWRVQGKARVGKSKC